MKQYWFDLFDAATTSSDKNNLVSPIEPKIIAEYFGQDVTKIFVQWFIARRKQINK